MSQAQANVKVAVRIRPLVDSEIEQGMCTEYRMCVSFNCILEFFVIFFPNFE